MSQTHDAVVTISLLDPLRGDAIQSWEFEAARLIRFGRDDTNDVVLSDARVSRVHGEVSHNEGSWTVTPLGRNGIAIGGQPIARPTPLGQEAVLRLAAGGPYVEFRVGRRRNTPADRVADQHRWAAAREREEEEDRASRTDVTEVDFLNRPSPGKPAN
jgi:pSer/pThr/pTyr-binding forkhead associated (FHA) protein